MLVWCATACARAAGSFPRPRIAPALAAASSLFAASPALAADLPFFPAPAAEPFYRWEGPYVGAHVGYLRGNNDFTLSGFPDGAFTGLIPPIPTATSAITQGFIGGVQGGYLHQIDAFVFGFEQDFTGSTSSGAVGAAGTASGLGFGLAQEQDVEWLGTLRGRIGFAPNDRVMIHVSGGLAFGEVKASTNLTLSNGLAFNNISHDFRTGWAAGAGVEYALGRDFSLTLDYLHFELGDVTVVGLPNVAASFETHTNARLSGDIARAGINYRWDNDDRAAYARGAVPLVPPIVRTLETEVGVRYWYSTGRSAKDLYDPAGSSLVSRLTHTDLTASSGEGFFRFDERHGLFAKGFSGAGVIGSGNLLDEDFPPGISPYSATNSAQRNGNLLYFSGDVGYDFWRGPGYKLGAFGGIFYEREVLNAFGCTQIASNPLICNPTISDPTFAIANDSRWLAARLGLNGQVTWWNCVKLEADVAWLPYVSLTSSDSHMLRMQPIPGNFSGPIPADGTGHDGVQVEAIVSYLISPTFSVGVGGRYWRMQTNGTAHFEDDIVGFRALPQPNNFVTERFGGFLQGAFKF